MTALGASSRALIKKPDSAGRESWYGRWYPEGDGRRELKRRVGAVRPPRGKTGLTRTEAEKAFEKLRAEVKMLPEKGDRLTVADLGDCYIEHLERQGRKKATIVAVESALRVWLVPYFGDRDANGITAEDVDDLMRAMESGTKPGARQRGDRRFGRKVGPKSIRNYVGTLSAMLAFGHRKKRLSGDVFVIEDLPKVKRSKNIRYLTVAQLQALVAAVEPGPYEAIDRALYLTGAMTGLRQGELVALRQENVDYVNRQVRVLHNFVLNEFGTPKSDESERAVPLADPVAVELARLDKATGERGDAALVFPDPFTGGPLDKAAILRRFKRALKAAQIKPHRFHDLRHTFGTAMAAAGVPIRTLQEWMGHRDIQTTMIYAAYQPKQREADLIEAAFGHDDPVPVEVTA